MTCNRLLLNLAKIEVLWCSSARCQHQFPVGPVRIGNTSVLPVSAVRDLGIYIDADLTMSTHVTTTVRPASQHSGGYEECGVPSHVMLC